MKKVEGLTSNFGGRFARIFDAGQVFVGRFVRSFLKMVSSVRNYWYKRLSVSVGISGRVR